MNACIFAIVHLYIIVHLVSFLLSRDIMILSCGELSTTVVYFGRSEVYSPTSPENRIDIAPNFLSIVTRSFYRQIRSLVQTLDPRLKNRIFFM